VQLAENVSVWPGAVVRGDNDLIAIKSGTNIQDGAVLHVDPGHPMSIGCNVTVGHVAVVHGCTIGDGSLVGIHATVLNDAKIGNDSIVAAGSVVPEGKSYPDRSLILGVPGKVVRELTDDEVKWIADNARDYAARATLYRNHLK
jgi:carbonic anhydrase/acetyltransferase-like protein (isoleucine patch superfamily)